MHIKHSRVGKKFRRPYIIRPSENPNAALRRKTPPRKPPPTQGGQYPLQYAPLWISRFLPPDGRRERIRT
ncbi:hypothetical protein HMPREF9123_0768 [Neisseria bacilliformis ATCC BAA-1200]|uniref:Uncharacterized protein n=1 Tax=Neisseria bacilliformis ATCC BAA-1200 TaxID=888742 RepID=F2BAN7_9NEIS|nr:hypothetical protein HMPREF9123_0768 [Neisseria bacilliformis ATCC BAA-1200]